MPDTVINMPPRNGAGSGHDTGYDFAPGTSAAPTMPELRIEIRDLIAARPSSAPDDATLLALMAQHDAGMGAALLKLPEREGVGGAVLATLVKKYRGAIDPYRVARAISSALVFWPDPVPADERLEDAILRLGDFNLDAARELARAYIFLGARFGLQYSLRVVLDKYGIRPEEFNATNALPADGLSPDGLEVMLGQGQIELVNELLRPHGVAIRQKIGTVKPVYSIVEGTNGRHVMPAPDLVEFLRQRGVFG